MRENGSGSSSASGRDIGQIALLRPKGAAGLGGDRAVSGGRESGRQTEFFEPGSRELNSAPQWVDLRGLRVERVREFGNVYLGLSLWRRLGRHKLLGELIESGREEIAWEQIACLLTIARFCAQRSELAIAERWFCDTALEDLLGVQAEQINEDRLYRGLDVLQRHKDRLCAHLLERYQSWFGVGFEFLLYDVTSTFFEGEALHNKKAARGYIRDSRADCKQVCIGLVVDRNRSYKRCADGRSGHTARDGRREQQSGRPQSRSWRGAAPWRAKRRVLDDRPRHSGEKHPPLQTWGDPCPGAKNTVVERAWAQRQLAAGADRGVWGATEQLWNAFHNCSVAPQTPTTTLNQPDPIPEFESLAASSHLSRDAEESVFAEPWQAQAFALAVKLSEQGHFTCKEWAAALADELKATSHGEPDDDPRYYHHWLAALEHLLTAKGLADPEALLARKEAWAEAYRRTPHGKPVELGVGSGSPES